MVEQLLRRDRTVAAIALLVLTALAWASLLHMRSGMASSAGADMSMPGMGMSGMQAWSALELVMLFSMWATMMVAMMLPSAAPMILLVASIQRRRQERESPAPSTAVFAAGYLVVWTAFSAVAATVQYGLHRAALLSPTMASTTPILGGLILVTAGVYQLLPFKSTCLTHCRSPMHFLQHEWREGGAGALLMGLRHGFFCLGCCWALMALLFVAGVMNLLWVAVIAGLVLFEKVARFGPWIGHLAGLMLIGWGVWMLAGVH